MNYILTCAYNEEKNVYEQINSLRCEFKDKNYKIIFVNDGSTDNTKEIVNSLKSDDLILLNHNKNLGLGCAIKTGLQHICSFAEENDVVITMDADNTHDVKIIRLMIEKINCGYDIVIASRYANGAIQIGVSILRRMLSFFANKFFKIIFNIPNVKDYTSGYRAYSYIVIKKLYDKKEEKPIEEKNFVIQLELLVKMITFNPKIVEVPIFLRYDKKYGKSKLKIVKTALSYIKFIVKTNLL